MLTVAQVKVVPVKRDLAANHRSLMAILDRMAERALDVVVTPECFLDGYAATEDCITQENIAQYAIDPAHSPYVEDVSAWCASQKSWLVLGCTRLVPDGVANSALIVDRKGALAGIYDKVHCQTCDQKFVAGRSLPVFESDFGVFGVMICADRRWPETVRTLALKGARIIFNPSWGQHDERNLHMMQTRAWESELFIVFTHIRQSLITGPRGEVLVNEISPDCEFSVTDIDLAAVDEARQHKLAHLRDRRPDVYSLG